MLQSEESFHLSEAEGGGAGAAAEIGEERDGGAGCELSPDRTPTNEVPSMPLLSGKKINILKEKD